MPALSKYKTVSLSAKWPVLRHAFYALTVIPILQLPMLFRRTRRHSVNLTCADKLAQCPNSADPVTSISTPTAVSLKHSGHCGNLMAATPPAQLQKFGFLAKSFNPLVFLAFSVVNAQSNYGKNAILGASFWCWCPRNISACFSSTTYSA
jgi:hypothetical protein